MATESERLFEDCNSITGVLSQLAGYASMCWTTVPVGEDAVEKVFDSERAVNAVNLADDRIRQIIHKDQEREFQPHPEPQGDYYDEDTLFKFHQSLAKCHIDDVEMVTNQVLNDGLLIRERR